MDYLGFGHSLIAQYPLARTLRGSGEHSHIWVKQAVPPKARIWHVLQKILAFCIPNPIIRATVSDGGSNALRTEVTRLHEFKAKGFHVPDVLAFNDEMLVITHLGPQLGEYLDHEPDADIRLAAIKKAMQALALLHSKGLAHGRPYLRDMTWDGGTIGFLDLEENPVDVMPLASAQAHDLWVFLSAASRFARDPSDKLIFRPDLIAILLREYQQTATSDAAMPELTRLIRMVKPLRVLFEQSWLWPHVGNDVRQSVFVTQCLEVYLPGPFFSSEHEKQEKPAPTE